MSNNKPNSPLLLFFFLSLKLVSAVDFIFNGFNSSDISIYGNTTLESNILKLTDALPRSMGRAFFPSKIPTKPPNSSSSTLLPFYTSFIFSIAPLKGSLPGHGFVFFFSPFSSMQEADPAQHLGLFNRSNDGVADNHVLGVEFDVFENPEFNDIDDNHVGIDVNSLTSVASHTAGYRLGEQDDDFQELKLNNGVNYQVWIDFLDFKLNVTMARIGMTRPTRPLLSVNLNLSDVFVDEMYVGFSAATGALVQSHRILSWGFSNSNSKVGDELITSNLPSFVLPGNSVVRSKGFIVGISVAVVVLIICCGLLIYWFYSRRSWKRMGGIDEMEEWELEYWPHRIKYQEIYAATKGFSDENVIGVGANGKVYKGVMVGGVQIAVKRISHGSEEGMRGFLAEVSSLGRLKHRNLVGFRGWCKREEGSLILVYDFMENGSLDKWIFDSNESKLLSWEHRVKVLKNVAEAILYLHEGWEVRVLHRDIKASNVLLDKDMCARLGDFGLARMHGHGKEVTTTRVIGTAGYMAPELIQSGRASAKTDVFGFGMVVLELICGRRPLEDGKPPLIDWVWRLMDRAELGSALDERLKAKGGFDNVEVEKLLQLGLLCVYPDPHIRPSMRQALKVLEGRCAEETDDEGMELQLLDKFKSSAMWSKYRHSLRHGAHPTFNEIKESLSSSMSLSGSDVIVEGR